MVQPVATIFGNSTLGPTLNRHDTCKCEPVKIQDGGRPLFNFLNFKNAISPQSFKLLQENSTG